jgi:hypothetical protein
LFFDKLSGKSNTVELVSVQEAAEEARVMAQMYSAAEA